MSAVDPYLDPKTGILANKVGARTAIELHAAEHDLAIARTIQLDHRPIGGKFDLDHLCAIHRHLFQDVYPFAGQLRTVNIHKMNDPEHGFSSVEGFGTAQTSVFGEIREEEFLRGFPRDRFVDRLAYHFDAINNLHPFREGNGRAQRAFVNALARQAGYRIDWTAVSAEGNVDASREGEEALETLFDRAVNELSPGDH